MIRTKISLIAFIVTFLSGCSSFNEPKKWFYWGDFSDVVYNYYNDEGNFSKQEQVINEIIMQAKQNNQKVGPGIYGHLGLILLKQGKQAEAKSAFQEEQRLYPESSTFMQYLQRKK